jgi:hypothetical protein
MTLLILAVGAVYDRRVFLSDSTDLAFMKAGGHSPLDSQDI